MLLRGLVTPNQRCCTPPSSLPCRGHKPRWAPATQTPQSSSRTHPNKSKPRCGFYWSDCVACDRRPIFVPRESVLCRLTSMRFREERTQWKSTGSTAETLMLTSPSCTWLSSWRMMNSWKRSDRWGQIRGGENLLFFLCISPILTVSLLIYDPGLSFHHLTFILSLSLGLCQWCSPNRRTEEDVDWHPPTNDCPAPRAAQTGYGRNGQAVHDTQAIKF